MRTVAVARAAPAALASSTADERAGFQRRSAWYHSSDTERAPTPPQHGAPTMFRAEPFHFGASRGLDCQFRVDATDFPLQLVLLCRTFDLTPITTGPMNESLFIDLSRLFTGADSTLSPETPLLTVVKYSELGVFTLFVKTLTLSTNTT